MRRRNDIICIVAVVMMPVKGEIVTGLYFDSIRSLNVAQYIATKVNRVYVFDWRVGISSCTWRAIVSGSPDSRECPLVLELGVQVSVKNSEDIKGGSGVLKFGAKNWSTNTKLEPRVYVRLH